MCSCNALFKLASKGEKNKEEEVPSNIIPTSHIIIKKKEKRIGIAINTLASPLYFLVYTFSNTPTHTYIYKHVYILSRKKSPNSYPGPRQSPNRIFRSSQGEGRSNHLVRHRLHLARSTRRRQALYNRRHLSSSYWLYRQA